MAIGDDAAAAGYPLVAGSGTEGKTRNGWLEFNRTRDFIAQLRGLLPNGKAGYRTAAGISSGTADPTGGTDGDVYFQIIG